VPNDHLHTAAFGEVETENEEKSKKKSSLTQFLLCSSLIIFACNTGSGCSGGRFKEKKTSFSLEKDVTTEP